MTVLDAAPAPLPGPPLRPEVQVLLDALDDVRASAATGSLADCAALLRAGEAVQGLALRELAVVDATRGYVDAGKASAAAVAEDVLGISRDSANAMVRLSGYLDRDARSLADLLQAGQVTVAHCRAVMHGVRGIEPHLVADSMPALCAAAQASTPAELSTALRERAHALDDGLAERRARRQAEAADFTLSELPDGGFLPSGTLRPETGQLLQAALDAEVHGNRTEGDTRSAAQRREAALGQLARHALQGEDSDLAGAPTTTLLVSVTLPRLVGEPAALEEAGTVAPAKADVARPASEGASVDGPPPRATFTGSSCALPDAQLLRLACEASVSRVVLDPAGVVVDLGRLTPTVSPAQRRAVIARDGHCVARRCRRRASRCEVHHVWHWARGGPSDLPNLALLCHEHHHDIHDRGVWLQHRDGRWLTPDGYLDDAATGPPP